MSRVTGTSGGFLAPAVAAGNGDRPGETPERWESRAVCASGGFLAPVAGLATQDRRAIGDPSGEAARPLHLIHGGASLRYVSKFFPAESHPWDARALKKIRTL
jgi:hypothetical protein